MAMESSQDFIKSLEKYQATKDLELRNELTMSCIYIVRSAASQMRGIASGYARKKI